MNCRLLCILLVALAGCGPFSSPSTGGDAASGPPASQPDAPVAVRAATTALAAGQPCAGSFVPRSLPHTTAVRGETVGMFESNGAGVAVNDLDGDGLLDLVFANLDGPNTVLWNRGDLRFEAQSLDDRNSRAVSIVDVDGDERQEIVFTHRDGGASVWRTGGARPARSTLPGVLEPAYAMAWADLSGDGTLDLVTGSYDSELAKRQRDRFMFGTGAGVFVYEQRAGSFVKTRLATESQALAIALLDLNRDRRPDIVAGNDFGQRDQTWLRDGAGWSAAEPFAATTHSTMSLDWGDLDNDGGFELFATDMKPYAIDTATLAAWLPVMATMPAKHAPGDPQIMDNVLQVRGADGRWHNEAFRRGVDATGWSWSGKFGDLDNDGFLDLYVVNGMIARELFHHLPGDELVEQNQARRNSGRGYFMPAPEWGLGSTAGGRGMSMADLDNDGDLDIVVNNLRAPAQLFENRLCGGAGLEVDLRWPASGNTRAIGARLVLHTDRGTYTRDVRATSGYLSGDPARVHFGFPADAVLERLEVRWPDGAISALARPDRQTLLTVTRQELP